MSRGSRALSILLPMAVAFSVFSSTGRDDSHITDWVAHALVRDGQLVNYNGERIEQSSSLLHVLVLAGVAKLSGLPVPALGVLTSIVFGGLTIWLTQRLARRIDASVATPAGWLAGTSMGLLHWSFGGLETTLAASAALALIVSYAHVLENGWTGWRLVATFGVTLAYLAVRPEAIFVLAVVFVGMGTLLVARSSSPNRHTEGEAAPVVLRRTAGIVMLAAVAGALLLICRHAYFGRWFPQPVTAKAGGLALSTARLGLNYVFHEGMLGLDGAVWVLALPAALVIAVRALRHATFEAASVWTALFFGAGVSFVVASGGDWMEGGRFLVPLMPLAVICALGELRRHMRPGLLQVIVGLMVAAQSVVVWNFARQNASGGPPWARDHVDARQVPADVAWFEVMQRYHYRDVICSERVIEVTRRVFQRTGRRVTIMSGQMGLIAYRTADAEFGRVRLIDRLGLVSADFTTCPVTASLRRRNVGLDLTYERFFSDRERLRQACGLGDPDVIFDLSSRDGSRERLFEVNGYRIVYRQDGTIANGSRWIPGAPVWGGEIIALREDLVDPGLVATGFRFGS